MPPKKKKISISRTSGEQSLEQISWDEFFDKFEKEKLAFLHQDGRARGKTSRFNKLIARWLNPAAEFATDK